MTQYLPTAVTISESQITRFWAWLLSGNDVFGKRNNINKDLEEKEEEEVEEEGRNAGVAVRTRLAGDSEKMRQTQRKVPRTSHQQWCHLARNLNAHARHNIPTRLL